MPPGINKPERSPEGLPKALRVVSHHRQAAAFFRAVERKRCDDGVPPDFHATPKPLNVRGAVTFFGQKMKCCTVMPDVVGLLRLPDRGVGRDPMNLIGTAAKARPGGQQRGIRQIEHCYIVITAIDETIDKS